jgi:hypothetical protein
MLPIHTVGFGMPSRFPKMFIFVGIMSGVRFQVLFLFVLLYVTSGKAQTGLVPGFGVEVNEFGGHVIKHTVKFELPIPSLTTGTDINLVWKTYGRKEWHQRRRYPTLGLGLAYTNYGIDSIYGRCFSLFPNITFPVVAGEKFEWTLRIGDGMGYVTRHYTRMSPSDTINNAIGSHINDYASFNTDLRYHVNDHLDLQAGFNFSHISNASYQQPNLGINLAGAHVGIRYFPTTANPKRVVRDLKPLRNNWGLAVNAGIAFNQPPPAGGPAYPVYLTSAYVTKKWISKNKLFAGVDYSYHESIAAFLRNNNIYTGSEWKHAYKSAAFCGNEFLLGRLGVVLQLGYYVKDAALSQGIYYEKLGANLYLKQKQKGVVKDVFVCGFLKVHKFVAELAEFGFGFGF